MNRIYKLKFSKKSQDFIAVSELATKAVAQNDNTSEDLSDSKAASLRGQVVSEDDLAQNVTIEASPLARVLTTCMSNQGFENGLSHRLVSAGLLATTAFAGMLGASSDALANNNFPSGIDTGISANQLVGPSHSLGQVISGQVSAVTRGQVTEITNSPNAIINWQQFNIGQHEVVKFIQQNANSSVLNRVLGNQVSQILGTLQSNGHVFIINPNGIVFGKHASVDVGVLVASTLNITNENFAKGRYVFDQDKDSAIASVINRGMIKVNGDGSIALIGGNVLNNGVLKSVNGSVFLLAGNTIEIADFNNPLISYKITAKNKAVNLGKIFAGKNATMLGSLVVNGPSKMPEVASLAGALAQANDQQTNQQTVDAKIDAHGQVMLYGGSESDELQSTSQTDAQVTGIRNSVVVNNGEIHVHNKAGKPGVVKILGDVTILDSHSKVYATGKVKPSGSQVSDFNKLTVEKTSKAGSKAKSSKPVSLTKLTGDSSSQAGSAANTSNTNGATGAYQGSAKVVSAHSDPNVDLEYTHSNKKISNQDNTSNQLTTSNNKNKKINQEQFTTNQFGAKSGQDYSSSSAGMSLAQGSAQAARSSSALASGTSLPDSSSQVDTYPQGGVVYVGGDALGAGSVKLSRYTRTISGSQIDVSAQGNAGKVAIWGDKAQIGGSIKGESIFGKGSLVETSGHVIHIDPDFKNYLKGVDLKNNGEWLIDPDEIYIVSKLSDLDSLPAPYNTHLQRTRKQDFRTFVGNWGWRWTQYYYSAPNDSPWNYQNHLSAQEQAVTSTYLLADTLNLRNYKLDLRSRGNITFYNVNLDEIKTIWIGILGDDHTRAVNIVNSSLLFQLSEALNFNEHNVGSLNIVNSSFRGKLMYQVKSELRGGNSRAVQWYGFDKTLFRDEANRIINNKKYQNHLNIQTSYVQFLANSRLYLNTPSVASERLGVDSIAGINFAINIDSSRIDYVNYYTSDREGELHFERAVNTNITNSEINIQSDSRTLFSSKNFYVNNTTFRNDGEGTFIFNGYGKLEFINSKVEINKENRDNTVPRVYFEIYNDLPQPRIIDGYGREVGTLFENENKHAVLNLTNFHLTSKQGVAAKGGLGIDSWLKDYTTDVHVTGAHINATKISITQNTATAANNYYFNDTDLKVSGIDFGASVTKDKRSLYLYNTSLVDEGAIDLGPRDSSRSGINGFWGWLHNLGKRPGASREPTQEAHNRELAFDRVLIDNSGVMIYDANSQGREKNLQTLNLSANNITIQNDSVIATGNFLKLHLRNSNIHKSIILNKSILVPGNGNLYLDAHNANIVFKDSNIDIAEGFGVNFTNDFYNRLNFTNTKFIVEGQDGANFNLKSQNVLILDNTSFSLGQSYNYNPFNPKYRKLSFSPVKELYILNGTSLSHLDNYKIHTQDKIVISGESTIYNPFNSEISIWTTNPTSTVTVQSGVNITADSGNLTVYSEGDLKIGDRTIFLNDLNFNHWSSDTHAIKLVGRKSLEVGSQIKKYGYKFLAERPNNYNIKIEPDPILKDRKIHVHAGGDVVFEDRGWYNPQQKQKFIGDINASSKSGSITVLFSHIDNPEHQIYINNSIFNSLGSATQSPGKIAAFIDSQSSSNPKLKNQLSPSSLKNTNSKFKVLVNSKINLLNTDIAAGSVEIASVSTLRSELDPSVLTSKTNSLSNTPAISITGGNILSSKDVTIKGGEVQFVNNLLSSVSNPPSDLLSNSLTNNLRNKPGDLTKTKQSNIWAGNKINLDSGKDLILDNLNLKHADNAVYLCATGNLSYQGELNSKGDILFYSRSEKSDSVIRLKQVNVASSPAKSINLTSKEGSIEISKSNLISNEIKLLASTNVSLEQTTLKGSDQVSLLAQSGKKPAKVAVDTKTIEIANYKKLNNPSTPNNLRANIVSSTLGSMLANQSVNLDVGEARIGYSQLQAGRNGSLNLNVASNHLLAFQSTFASLGQIPSLGKDGLAGLETNDALLGGINIKVGLDPQTYTNNKLIGTSSYVRKDDLISGIRNSSSDPGTHVILDHIVFNARNSKILVQAFSKESSQGSAQQALNATELNITNSTINAHTVVLNTSNSLGFIHSKANIENFYFNSPLAKITLDAATIRGKGSIGLYGVQVNAIDTILSGGKGVNLVLDVLKNGKSGYNSQGFGKNSLIAQDQVLTSSFVRSQLLSDSSQGASPTQDGGQINFKGINSNFKFERTILNANNGIDLKGVRTLEFVDSRVASSAQKDILLGNFFTTDNISLSNTSITLGNPDFNQNVTLQARNAISLIKGSSVTASGNLNLGANRLEITDSSLANLDNSHSINLCYSEIVQIYNGSLSTPYLNLHQNNTLVPEQLGSSSLSSAKRLAFLNSQVEALVKNKLVSSNSVDKAVSSSSPESSQTSVGYQPGVSIVRSTINIGLAGSDSSSNNLKAQTGSAKGLETQLNKQQLAPNQPNQPKLPNQPSLTQASPKQSNTDQLNKKQASPRKQTIVTNSDLLIYDSAIRANSGSALSVKSSKGMLSLIDSDLNAKGGASVQVSSDLNIYNSNIDGGKNVLELTAKGNLVSTTLEQSNLVNTKLKEDYPNIYLNLVSKDLDANNLAKTNKNLNVENINGVSNRVSSSTVGFKPGTIKALSVNFTSGKDLSLSHETIAADKVNFTTCSTDGKIALNMVRFGATGSTDDLIDLKDSSKTLSLTKTKPTQDLANQLEKDKQATNLQPGNPKASSLKDLSLKSIADTQEGLNDQNLLKRVGKNVEVSFNAPSLSDQGSSADAKKVIKTASLGTGTQVSELQATRSQTTGSLLSGSLSANSQDSKDLKSSATNPNTLSLDGKKSNSLSSYQFSGKYVAFEAENVTIHTTKNLSLDQTLIHTSSLALDVQDAQSQNALKTSTDLANKKITTISLTNLSLTALGNDAAGLGVERITKNNSNSQASLTSVNLGSLSLKLSQTPNSQINLVFEYASLRGGGNLVVEGGLARNTTKLVNTNVEFNKILLGQEGSLDLLNTSIASSKLYFNNGDDLNVTNSKLYGNDIFFINNGDVTLQNTKINTLSKYYQIQAQFEPQIYKDMLDSEASQDLRISFLNGKLIDSNLVRGKVSTIESNDSKYGEDVKNLKNVKNIKDINNKDAKTSSGKTAITKTQTSNSESDSASKLASKSTSEPTSLANTNQPNTPNTLNQNLKTQYQNNQDTNIEPTSPRIKVLLSSDDLSSNKNTIGYKPKNSKSLEVNTLPNQDSSQSLLVENLASQADVKFVVPSLEKSLDKETKETSSKLENEVTSNKLEKDALIEKSIVSNPKDLKDFKDTLGNLNNLRSKAKSVSLQGTQTAQAIQSSEVSQATQATQASQASQASQDSSQTLDSLGFAAYLLGTNREELIKKYQLTNAKTSLELSNEVTKTEIAKQAGKQVENQVGNKLTNEISPNEISSNGKTTLQSLDSKDALNKNLVNKDLDNIQDFVDSTRRSYKLSGKVTLKSTSIENTNGNIYLYSYNPISFTTIHTPDQYKELQAQAEKSGARAPLNSLSTINAGKDLNLEVNSNLHLGAALFNAGNDLKIKATHLDVGIASVKAAGNVKINLLDKNNSLHDALAKDVLTKNGLNKLGKNNLDNNLVSNTDLSLQAEGLVGESSSLSSAKDLDDKAKNKSRPLGSDSSNLNSDQTPDKISDNNPTHKMNDGFITSNYDLGKFGSNGLRVSAGKNLEISAQGIDLDGLDARSTSGHVSVATKDGLVVNSGILQGNMVGVSTQKGSLDIDQTYVKATDTVSISAPKTLNLDSVELKAGKLFKASAYDIVTSFKQKPLTPSLELNAVHDLDVKDNSHITTEQNLTLRAGNILTLGKNVDLSAGNQLLIATNPLAQNINDKGEIKFGDYINLTANKLVVKTIRGEFSANYLNVKTNSDLEISGDGSASLVNGNFKSQGNIALVNLGSLDLKNSYLEAACQSKIHTNGDLEISQSNLTAKGKFEILSDQACVTLKSTQIESGQGIDINSHQLTQVSEKSTLIATGKNILISSDQDTSVSHSKLEANEGDIGIKAANNANLDQVSLKTLKGKVAIAATKGQATLVNSSIESSNQISLTSKNKSTLISSSQANSQEGDIEIGSGHDSKVVKTTIHTKQGNIKVESQNDSSVTKDSSLHTEKGTVQVISHHDSSLTENSQLSTKQGNVALKSDHDSIVTNAKLISESGKVEISANNDSKVSESTLQTNNDQVVISSKNDSKVSKVTLKTGTGKAIISSDNNSQVHDTTLTTNEGDIKVTSDKGNTLLDKTHLMANRGDAKVSAGKDASLSDSSLVTGSGSIEVISGKDASLEKTKLDTNSGDLTLKSGQDSTLKQVTGHTDKGNISVESDRDLTIETSALSTSHGKVKVSVERDISVSKNTKLIAHNGTPKPRVAPQGETQGNAQGSELNLDSSGISTSSKDSSVISTNTKDSSSISTSPKESSVVSIIPKESLADSPAKESAKPLEKDLLANDPATNNKIVKDQIAKDQLEKDPISKDPISKDPIAKDPIAKDQVAKNKIVKDPVVSKQLTTNKVKTDKTSASQVESLETTSVSKAAVDLDTSKSKESPNLDSSDSKASISLKPLDSKASRGLGSSNFKPKFSLDSSSSKSTVELDSSSSKAIVKLDSPSTKPLTNLDSPSSKSVVKLDSSSPKTSVKLGSTSSKSTTNLDSLDSKTSTKVDSLSAKPTVSLESPDSKSLNSLGSNLKVSLKDVKTTSKQTTDDLSALNNSNNELSKQKVREYQVGSKEVGSKESIAGAIQNQPTNSQLTLDPKVSDSKVLDQTIIDKKPLDQETTLDEKALAKKSFVEKPLVEKPLASETLPSKTLPSKTPTLKPLAPIPGSKNFETINEPNLPNLDQPQSNELVSTSQSFNLGGDSEKSIQEGSRVSLNPETKLESISSISVSNTKVIDVSDSKSKVDLDKNTPIESEKDLLKDQNSSIQNSVDLNSGSSKNNLQVDKSPKLQVDKSSTNQPKTDKLITGSTVSGSNIHIDAGLSTSGGDGLAPASSNNHFMLNPSPESGAVIIESKSGKSTFDTVQVEADNNAQLVSKKDLQVKKSTVNVDQGDVKLGSGANTVAEQASLRTNSGSLEVGANKDVKVTKSSKLSSDFGLIKVEANQDASVSDSQVLANQGSIKVLGRDTASVERSTIQTQTGDISIAGVNKVSIADSTIKTEVGNLGVDSAQGNSQLDHTNLVTNQGDLNVNSGKDTSILNGSTLATNQGSVRVNSAQNTELSNIEIAVNTGNALVNSGKDTHSTNTKMLVKQGNIQVNSQAGSSTVVGGEFNTDKGDLTVNSGIATNLKDLKVRASNGKLALKSQGSIKVDHVEALTENGDLAIESNQDARVTNSRISSLNDNIDIKSKKGSALVDTSVVNADKNISIVGEKEAHLVNSIAISQNGNVKLDSKSNTLIENSGIGAKNGKIIAHSLVGKAQVLNSSLTSGLSQEVTSSNGEAKIYNSNFHSTEGNLGVGGAISNIDHATINLDKGKLEVDSTRASSSITNSVINTHAGVQVYSSQDSNVENTNIKIETGKVNIYSGGRTNVKNSHVDTGNQGGVFVISGGDVNLKKAEIKTPELKIDTKGRTDLDHTSINGNSKIFSTKGTSITESNLTGSCGINIIDQGHVSIKRTIVDGCKVFISGKDFDISDNIIKGIEGVDIYGSYDSTFVRNEVSSSQFVRIFTRDAKGVITIYGNTFLTPLIYINYKNYDPAYLDYYDLEYLLGTEVDKTKAVLGKNMMNSEFGSYLALDQLGYDEGRDTIPFIITSDGIYRVDLATQCELSVLELMAKYNLYPGDLKDESLLKRAVIQPNDLKLLKVCHAYLSKKDSKKRTVKKVLDESDIDDSRAMVSFFKRSLKKELE